jgi:hypothetical protein
MTALILFSIALGLCVPTLARLRHGTGSLAALVATPRVVSIAEMRDEWRAGAVHLPRFLAHGVIGAVVFAMLSGTFLSGTVHAQTPPAPPMPPGGTDIGTGVGPGDPMGTWGTGQGIPGIDASQSINTAIETGAMGDTFGVNNMLSSTAPSQMFDPSFGTMSTSTVDSNLLGTVLPNGTSFANDFATSSSPIMSVMDTMVQQSMMDSMRVVQDQARLAAMMANQALVGPDGCPTQVPASHNVAPSIDVYDLCARSVAAARTPAAATAIKFAMAQIGKPYCRPDRPSNCGGDGNRYGKGPAGGFDCSGLMTMAYKEGGVDFGAATWTGVMGQASWAINLSSGNDLRPGDMWLRVGDGDVNGHVAMVLADGYIVHAAGWERGVRLDRKYSGFDHFIAVEAPVS